MNLQQAKQIIENYPPELDFLISITGSCHNIKDINKLPVEFRWDRFIALMQRHQLTSLIFPYISKHRDQIPGTHYHKIKILHYRNIKKSFTHIQQTIHLQELFEVNHIPSLFLKGVVLSQMIYDGPTRKSSIDIDILLQRQYVGRVAELLKRQGYRMTYPKIDLNERQIRINYQISHHYEFEHTEKGVRVELHWKLINPHLLLPWSFEHLYARSVAVSLNDYPVQTLCKEDYLLYLAVHGAKHKWYNLAWLKDMSRMLEMTSVKDKEKMLRKSEMPGIEKSFLQGCMLSELFFCVEQPNGIRNQFSRAERITEPPLHAISSKRQSIGSHKLRDLLYRFRLRRSMRYRLTLLFRLRTHHSDWAKIRLPGYLFFLYYPLRPLLWITERLMKRRGKG